MTAAAKECVTLLSVFKIWASEGHSCRPKPRDREKELSTVIASMSFSTLMRYPHEEKSVTRIT